MKFKETRLVPKANLLKIVFFYFLILVKKTESIRFDRLNEWQTMELSRDTKMKLERSVEKILRFECHSERR